MDSDVIVRYVMQDDAVQSAQATRLIESLTAREPGCLPLVAVAEVAWVLTGRIG